MEINPLQACQAGSRCDPAPDQLDVLTPGCGATHPNRPAGAAGRGGGQAEAVLLPPPACLIVCVCRGGRGGAASTYSGVSLLLGCQVVHDDEFLQVVLDGGLVVLPGRAEVSEGGPQPRLPKDVFGVAVHLPVMRGSWSRSEGSREAQAASQGCPDPGRLAATGRVTAASPQHLVKVGHRRDLVYSLYSPIPQMLPGNLPCAMRVLGGGRGGYSGEREADSSQRD